MILLKINKLKTLFFPVSPVDPLAIIGEDSTKRAKKQKQNKKQFLVRVAKPFILL